MGTWPTVDNSSLIAVDAVCCIIEGLHPESVLKRTCNNDAVGRYLIIQIDTNEFTNVLTLCEVEIYVDPCK